MLEEVGLALGDDGWTARGPVSLLRQQAAQASEVGWPVGHQLVLARLLAQLRRDGGVCSPSPRRFGRRC